MGVDISDIQVIYHHAPSGLLPDYVQEIGRAARDPKIKGFATLNYSSQDQRYTKALHGMSAIRQYQLKEVLKKIHKSFLKNKMNRNLLISIDDFGYIFENASDLDQKVLTALMMIEKDYLAKNRFNVIIARPKKLFVKVFARISDQHLKIFNARYQKSFKILKKEKNGQNIIEIDLDNLWLENFGNKSFPSIKRDFYTGYLFKNDNIEVIPQLKMSFERLEEINIVLSELQSFLDKLESVFSNFNGFFNQEDFQNKLNQILNDENKAEKLSKFILSSYSGRVTGFGVIEPNAFLQRRKVVDGFEYRVFSNQYLSSFSSLLKRFNKLFENNKRTIAERYVTSKEINAINYVRLGYFLELLELGTFEVKGGENPMVFIRINDPNRIERDSKSQYYSNTLLNKTLERHYLSNQIFDHFFLRSFSNSERWDFIEDFFLGSGIDQLLEEYKGGEVNHIGIIETLKTKKLKQIKVKAEKNQDCNVNIFFPIEGKVYCPKDLLTIEDESGTKTMKISEWLEKAPKSFDLARRKNSLLVNTEVFEILVSKLKAYEPEYFIEALGLKARIEFKGYDGLVQATVPYNDKPLEFYKWWCDNPHYLTLTFKEKLVLFDKVNMINPSVLKEEHISILNKK